MRIKLRVNYIISLAIKNEALNMNIDVKRFIRYGSLLRVNNYYKL